MSGSGGAEPPEPPGGYFPIVYDELRRLAAARLAGERAGHSLDATALVHEAYLRLGEASFANRNVLAPFDGRHSEEPLELPAELR